MKLNMKKILSRLLILSALSAPLSGHAQLTSTFYTNCIAAAALPLQCQTTTTNLLPTQYNTNNVWQGKNLGIGVSFVGTAATNTGTVGFQFAVRSQHNGVITTTKPFTITSTANGTNPVTDWAVIPAINLGPADALVLLSITNAAVNVIPPGSIIVSNVWLQMDTLSH